MKGRKTMIVTCTLCGSTFHGNIEPYCFDADKDPHWQKDLKKYQKSKWLRIDVVEHGTYKMVTANKCCDSGKSYDVPAGYPLQGKFVDAQSETAKEEAIKPNNIVPIPLTLF